jgi:hypothetical protein
MAIIDSQVHVYDADTTERPWRKSPGGPVFNWHDHVTGDEMVAAMDAAGVDGAIIVSPISLYGYDASYAETVQRAHPGRFALVKPVNSTRSGDCRCNRRPDGTPGADQLGGSDTKPAVTFEDAKSDPATAVSLVQQSVRDDAVAILGPATSPETMASGPIAESAGIPC